MERKIGEIFKYKGVSIKCVKSEKHDNCNKCYFKRDIGYEILRYAACQ